MNFGESAAERFGMFGILQDQGALDVGAAVEAAGQFEMAGADGAYLLENLSNFFALHHAVHLPWNGRVRKAPGSIAPQQQRR